MSQLMDFRHAMHHEKTPEHEDTFQENI